MIDQPGPGGWSRKLQEQTVCTTGIKLWNVRILKFIINMTLTLIKTKENTFEDKEFDNPFIQ